MAGTTPLAASMPAFYTAAELRANAMQAIDELDTLLTNFNAGGLGAMFIEALCILLGADASTIPGSTLEGGYELLADVRDAAYITTAKGIFLDLKCADVGVFRKKATYASTGVIFTLPDGPAGAGGYAIQDGQIVQADPADPTQNPVLFKVLAGTTIPEGSATSPNVTVQCVTAGSIGNVDPGAINTVVGIGGLRVTNPAKAAGGNDQEEDDSPNGGLRARGLSAIPNASQGTISALEADALTYPSIVSAVYVENTDDDGVTPLRGRGQLYVDDGTADLGDPTNANNVYLVQMQQDFTSGKYRAAGTQTNVVGSKKQGVTIALQIDVAQSWLNAGNAEADLVTSVQNAVFGLIQDSVLAHPVVLASIVETAKEVAGVSNVPLSSVTINGVASDFNMPTAQYVARCVNGPQDVTVTVNQITTYA